MARQCNLDSSDILGSSLGPFTKADIMNMINLDPTAQPEDEGQQGGEEEEYGDQ